MRDIDIAHTVDTTDTIHRGTDDDDDDGNIIKGKEEFRNYINSSRQEIVENHYYEMRKNQTLEFVLKMHQKYSFSSGGRTKMTIKQAFHILESYVDSSDPDISLPNMIHMFQTAEGIRRDGHPDWMQLVGLIHDMGKIMYLWGSAEDGQKGTAEGPQWALGGDTWVVGCRIPDCTVFPQFNTLNPDMNHEVYSTELGIYTPKCGLDNLYFAYGHDEYLYQMVIANKCTIPEEGLAMIRYHSAYPWHSGGAYRIFMNESDEQKLQSVLEFNKYDLYTKDESGLLLPSLSSSSSSSLTVSSSMEELWSYYERLIGKYFPSSELIW